MINMNCYFSISKATFWNKLQGLSPVTMVMKSHFSEYSDEAEAGLYIGGNPVFRDDSVPDGFIKINYPNS